MSYVHDLVRRKCGRYNAACGGDPVIIRQNWLRSYDFVTDKGALALNDYARSSDPFAKAGKLQIAVDISSVIRASGDSFRVAWTERRYENGMLAATERWTAILTIVVDAPRCRASPEKSARPFRPCHQLVEGTRLMRLKSFVRDLLVSVSFAWLRVQAAFDRL